MPIKTGFCFLAVLSKSVAEYPVACHGEIHFVSCLAPVCWLFSSYLLFQVYYFEGFGYTLNNALKREANAWSTTIKL
ncbi:MAG: hypothetical protein WC959_00940 [Kiritimatiellales bacterium]